MSLLWPKLNSISMKPTISRVKATSFNDLRGEISKRKVLKTLKELYGDARKLKVNKKLYVESDRMQKPW